MRKLHISEWGVINSYLRNSKRVIKNTLNNSKPANLMTQVRWPNKFLEIHNLPKSIQGKIDNLNNSGDVQVLASQSSLIFQAWLLAITKALPGRSLVKADFSTWCRDNKLQFLKKVAGKGSGPAGKPYAYV